MMSAYTGREQAFRRFVDGDLEEGDLDKIREFLKIVVENEMCDNLDPDFEVIGKHIEAALESELDPGNKTASSLAEGLTNDVYIIAGDAMVKVLTSVSEQLAAKLIEDPYGVKLVEMEEFCPQELIERIMDVVKIINNRSETAIASSKAAIEKLKGEVNAVVLGLDTPIQSYVSDRFRRAGLLPKVEAPSLRLPDLAASWQRSSQPEPAPSSSAVDDLDGEDIPF